MAKVAALLQSLRMCFLFFLFFIYTWQPNVQTPSTTSWYSVRPETGRLWGRSPTRSYQKWHLLPPCLAFSNLEGNFHIFPGCDRHWDLNSKLSLRLNLKVAPRNWLCSLLGVLNINFSRLVYWPPSTQNLSATELVQQCVRGFELFIYLFVKSLLVLAIVLTATFQCSYALWVQCSVHLLYRSFPPLL